MMMHLVCLMLLWFDLSLRIHLTHPTGFEATAFQKCDFVLVLLKNKQKVCFTLWSVDGSDEPKDCNTCSVMLKTKEPSIIKVLSSS